MSVCPLFKPCDEKTCLGDFRPGVTQTGLYSYRRLEISDLGNRGIALCSENKITVQLICVFVFGIMITFPCDLYPLTPNFCIVKLGFTGVYIIFTSPGPKAHRCAYSIQVEPASVHPSVCSHFQT